MQEWVDWPTDEEFTALHFAVYHGNWELIQILVEQLGANYELCNIYGANVLHIAAQGDQPAPLYYFSKIKGLDIDSLGVQQIFLTNSPWARIDKKFS